MLNKSIIVGKTTLAERISENLKRQKKETKINLNKTQVGEMIDKLLEEIETSLLKGEEIRLQNYFSLRTVMTKERRARNLKTGKNIIIPAGKTVRAKFSAKFKEKIAQKGKKKVNKIR